MAAGALKTAIIVQEPVEERDEYGNVRQSWRDGPRIPSDFRETLGRQKLELGRTEDQRTATVRIRTSAAARRIGAGNRIMARGEAWRVMSAAPVADGRKWIDLLLELDG